jgi:HAMP domain
MASKVANESRKLQDAGNEHHKRVRPNRTQKAEDAQVLLVSQEIQRLVEASRAGRLAERGKADQFEGVYREMMQGVNEMLDAILLPIGEGNRILAQISQGKIDELIA